MSQGTLCQKQHSTRTQLSKYRKELTVVKRVKNFPSLMKPNTALYRVYKSLHLASIQTTSSHPISLTSVLILSSHLRLSPPCGVFPSGFTPNILYSSLVTIPQACEGGSIETRPGKPMATILSRYPMFPSEL